ncbi:MAG: PAS domain S-box protein [Bacteroidales bacterium]
MEEKIVSILAIDDNPDNLVVLKGLLSEAFPWATLHTASSGKKGIEMCSSLKPDVVLLDIAMPGMDGFEVCTILKSDPQLSHIPVVMVTAISATTKTRIKALEAGADAFLAKPIDESELTAQVRAMLRIKSAEDQKISEKERLEILVQQRTIELERELQERRKVELALQQSIQKLEKSMSGEVRLTADLRNEISMREAAETQVLEHLHEQQILAKASKTLVGIKSSSEVSKYIGQLVYEASGNNMVFAAAMETTNNSVKISHSFGMDEVFEKTKRETGFDAHALEIMLSEYSAENFAIYRSRELYFVANDPLYELSAHKVDKQLCTNIEKLIGIVGAYTIGFIWNDQLFGGLVIIKTDKSELRQQKLIESLVNLASVALQRLSAEEQLQKEHANLDAILASSPVGMLVIDENQHITLANPAASRIFDIKPEKIRNLRCGEFLGCINSQTPGKGCGYAQQCKVCNIMDSIQEALSKGVKISDEEHEIIRQNNGMITTSLWVQFSIEPLLLNQRKHVILSLNDISLRKQAENGITKTKNHFKSIIEHAPDGVVLINIDGSFKFVSNAALKIFGYETEDLVAYHPDELTHPEDLPRVVEKLTELIQNPALIPTVEYRFRCSNGEWVWIQSTFSNLLANPDVEAIVINFRDITERVAAEEALKVSETKYRELFESNKDGISIFYITPDNIPGKFVEVNKAAAEMLGYTREEFLTFSIADITLNDEHSLIPKREQEIREKGYFSMENKLRCKDGTYIDAEIMAVMINYNNRIAIMNIVRDITERKRAAELILEKEEHLSTLINTTSDIICFKDGEGRWLRANKAFLECFHVNDKDYYLKTDAELVEYSHPAFKKAFSACENSDENAWIKKSTLIADEVIPLVEGGNKIYEIAKTPLFYPDGRRKGLVVFGRDITQRKHDEEALKESRQQLMDIIDFLPDATFVIDNDKKVIAWNKAMEEMTGIPKKDMIGQGNHAYTIPFYGRRQMQLLDLIDSSDQELKKRYNNFLRKGKSIYAEIFAPQLHNGRGAYISNVGAPLYNSSGERVGSIESIRDITEIKKAEEALRESEEKYRTMVDLMPDAVFIHNGETFMYANIATANMLGIDLPVKNISIYNFVHPDYTSKLRKKVEQCFLSGKAVPLFEMKFVSQEGKSIDVETIGIPITYMGKPAIQGIAHDITARKKAERQLILKDELLHLTGQMAKVGGWEYDIIANERNWSEEVLSIFGTNRKGIEHSNFQSNAFKGESLAKLQAAVNKVIKDQIPYDLELEVIAYDGTKKWVRTIGIPVTEAGKLIKIRGIYQDITDKKEAEIVLNNERTLLRTLIKTIPDLVWLKDPEGRYLLCNPTYENFFGKNESEIVGKSDNDFETSEIARKISDQDHKVLASGKPSILRQWETSIATRQDRLLEIIKTPMHNGTGDLIGLLGIARDMTAFHQSQETLREREEIYSTIVNQAIDAIVMVDADTGEFLEFNEAAYVGLGYTREEFSKLTIFDIEGNIKPEKLLPFLANLKNSGSKVFETKHRTKNNIIKDVRISARTINIRGKDYLASIWTDITERNQQEAMLREKDLIFQSLLENSPFYVFFKDHQSKAIFLSRNYEQLFNRSINSLIGKDLYEIADPEYSAEYIAAEQQMLQDGKQIEYVETYQGRIYSTVKFPIYRSDAPPMLAGFTIDITEQQQAVNALRENESMLRTIIEHAPFEIWARDKEGYGTLENNILVNHFGSILGKTPDFSDVSADVKELWNSNNRRALNGEIINNECVYLFDGIAHHYHQILAPIVVEGKVEGIAGFNIDITDRKKAEEEVHKLNAELEQRVNQRTLQLEHANRELEAFSYSVSHDLRAPLRGIDGWSLALLEDYGPQLDEQAHVYLDRVRSEAQRMGQLIDDLLKLSRVSRFEMNKAEVNLSAMAEIIVNRLTELNPLRQFDFKITPGIMAVADAAMLEIVLTNLLDNAVKFTSKKPFASIEFDSLIEDGRTVYSVRDNGAGFDMENARKLFGAFQRMHRQTEFQGTGVGLATVQRIIHRHGGQIWAESKANEGAAFYFTLGEI